MPSERDLSIYRGIAQGLERGVENFYNIRKALSEEEDRKRKSDVDFKIKKLQPSKAEEEMSPEALSLARENLKTESAAAKAVYNLNVLKIKEKKEEVKTDIMSRQMFLKRFNEMQSGKNLAPGEKLTYGGMTLSGPALKSGGTAIDESLIYPGRRNNQTEFDWSRFK